MNGALRVVEHHLTVYRRTWKGSVFMSFISPILFLAAMGLGLGSLISRGPVRTVDGVAYLVFLAPGLLAASAMQSAYVETTYPIMARIQWERTYEGMLATPIAVLDVLAGEFGWVAFWLALGSGAFFLVMLVFWTIHSVLAGVALGAGRRPRPPLLGPRLPPGPGPPARPGVCAGRSLQLPAPDRAAHLVERNAIMQRRGWPIILSGFVEPLLYLLAIGFGVGALVSASVVVDGHPLRYAVFVAPAMMASSAMNGAIYETAFNFFFKLKYVKLYDAVIATPLGIADIALGEITWALIRGTLYSFGFIVVMAALGLVISPWALLALPAAMLIGFSFAAVGTAASTFVRSWQDFDLVLTVLIPLFLFSATFYPITTYPGPLQLVVQLTPLYHGVDLLRSLTTGIIGPSILLDTVYLVVLGAAALAVAATRLERLLLK